jgi:hypothetical protein
VYVKSRAAIAPLGLAVYSLLFAHDALRAHFAPDDLGNLAGYWKRGFLVTLGDCLAFWTTAYRPMGGLFYLPIYSLFGLNPLPYRILILAIVCINVQLVFYLARLLTRSWAAAALTAILFCAHASLAEIYYSSSSIYDVLACFFSVGVLLSYIRIRSAGRRYRGLWVGAGTLLLVAALGSKEIAVITPSLVLAYEVLFHGAPRSLSQFRQWAKHEGFVPLLWMALGAIYIVGKFSGHDSLAGTEGYRLTLSWHQYVANNTIYIASLLRNSYFRGWRLALVVAILSAFCWRRGRPSLRWCWFFAAIVTLPISFIPTRGGASLYLPLLALALFASDVALEAFRFFATPLLRRTPRRFWMAASLIFVLAAWLAIARPLLRSWPYRANLILASQEETWHVIRELRDLHVAPRAHSRVLFVNDPLEGYDMLYVAELVWNDPSLDIQLSRKMLGFSRDAGRFDGVFVFRGSVLVVEKVP